MKRNDFTNQGIIVFDLKTFVCNKSNIFFVCIVVIDIFGIEKRFDIILKYYIVLKCILFGCRSPVLSTKYKTKNSFEFTFHIRIEARKFIYLVHVIFSLNQYKFRILPNIEQLKRIHVDPFTKSRGTFQNCSFCLHFI